MITTLCPLESLYKDASRSKGSSNFPIFEYFKGVLTEYSGVTFGKDLISFDGSVTGFGLFCTEDEACNEAISPEPKLGVILIIHFSFLTYMIIKTQEQ